MKLQYRCTWVGIAWRRARDALDEAGRKVSRQHVRVFSVWCGQHLLFNPANTLAPCQLGIWYTLLVNFPRIEDGVIPTMCLVLVDPKHKNNSVQDVFFYPSSWTRKIKATGDNQRVTGLVYVISCQRGQTEVAAVDRSSAQPADSTMATGVFGFM